MSKAKIADQEWDHLGIGSYTVAEAARLLHVQPRSIRRWLGGYHFRYNGDNRDVPPLWNPQYKSAAEEQIELGFRDLIELRFISAFTNAGLGLKTIRHCLEYARECVEDYHPFSTQRFQTDGRTIFLESIEKSEDSKILDLKKKQYAFRQIVQQTFKDLDIEDGIVKRWRPFRGKQSIVIDPERSFGQPIASGFGVPTVTLAEAVDAEGSIDRVAELYDVPASVVRDAVNFEESLRAA